MKILLRILLVVEIMAFASPLEAQDQGFMYGKVSTRDGNEYIGLIQWGGEEIFWSDFFNASKLNAKVFGHILDERKDDEQDNSWLGIDWSLSGIWEDRHSWTVHEFVCQFGNIQSLEYRRDKRMLLTLKNGSVLEIGGSGYNDVLASIYVFDEEIGKIKISADRVRLVEFRQGPKRINEKPGDAISGTVFTTNGKEYKGMIQWDHDERTSNEKLDGEADGRDLSIPFAKISNIRPLRSGSKVTLGSGRQFLLTGTNDVNYKNKGIYVTHPDFGRVDIPWSYVEQVDFDEKPWSGPSFNDFKKPKQLSGRVTMLNGKKVSGYIVFDLDEIWGFEILDGDANKIRYQIPFSSIKSITPKNYNYSWIVLRNGDKVLLGDRRDVTDENGGLLIFDSRESEAVRVDWEMIEQIDFN